MERAKFKIIAFIITILMLLTIINLPVEASENVGTLIVQQDENTYIIYVQENLDTEFEFAFSNDKNESNFNYISSRKDSQNNNIAYVNENLKNLYFVDQEDTYIWVKEDDKMVLEGEKIDLNTSKTEKQLNSIKDITNKITVKSSADDENISINGESSKKYYYEIEAVSTSKDFQKLVEIIDEISKYTEKTNSYTKLEKYGELYDLYNKIVLDENDTNWKLAENLEIKKPYDAKENQKYILWLKDENGEIDLQILTAYQKVVTETQEKEKVIEVTSKLPITYDNSTILYVALAIVLVAIVAMIVIRKISDKRNY